MDNNNKEDEQIDKFMHNSIGFILTLTAVFIILKLIKIITWSWLWVLSPVWIVICIVLFLIMLVCIN